MGTSLSGLTPATTFDGLLKVGDNDPLTDILKPISTGDGTDTILQLSNSALSIGGDVAITGTTSDNTANSLLIERLDGTDLFQVRNDRNIYFGSTQYIRNGYRFYGDWEAYGVWDFNSDVNIGTGTGIANTRLLVKGSGATSATTSLLVQNSAGDELLSTNDDGTINFGQFALKIKNNKIWGDGNTNKSINLSGSNTYSAYAKHQFNTWDGTAYTEAMRITGLDNTSQFVGIGETTPTARLHVKGSGNDATTTALLVQNSDGTDMLSVKDDLSVVFNSTITSASSTLRFDVGGTGTIRMNSDKVAIGGNTTPTARLHVKGSGNDDTTTALLVQNSDASASLTYDDSGKVEIVGNSQTGFIETYGFGAVGFGNESGATILYGKSGGGILGAGLHTGSGYTAFGANSSSSQRVLIKGSGATSATTALLVQNSAGTDLLKVDDAGTVTLDTTATINAGIFKCNQTGSTLAGTYAKVNNTFLRASAQGINISASNTIPDASAQLQVDSTTQGFLPPRMTTTQRDAITTPAAGLMIYNTTTNKAQCYNGTAWQDLF